MRASKFLSVVIVVVTLSAAGCTTQQKDHISVFPTTPGTSWTYAEAGEVEGDVITVQYSVLDPVELKGQRLTPVAKSIDGLTRETKYYTVVGEKVLWVANSTGSDGQANVEWFEEPTQEPAVLKRGEEWKDGPFTFQVVRRENVEVRAGKYAAYVVEMEGSGYKDTLYYVDGIGLVKEEPVNQRELLSFKKGQ